MAELPRDDERARGLVLEHGWNSTSYQILNPGIAHWFAPGADCVVGYVRRHRVLVAAGAPVCAAASLDASVAAFEAFARRQGCRVCYVCAEQRLHSLLSPRRTHSAIALGAQPVWEPSEWDAVLLQRRSLRAQLNRARNKGVTVELLGPEEAARSAELRRCLRQWLSTRRLPPLHFLVEPLALEGATADRIVLAARRLGSVVAFLVASPAPARGGFLIEQIARSPMAPNGASELLIDAAMRRIATLGCRYATLGLVALAEVLPDEMRANPWWLRRMMAVARAHANRFYNFRGLLQFRAKLAPAAWEGVFAIATEPRFGLGTLYAMGGAFSGISPVLALAAGAAKAAQQELAWLRASLAHRRRP